MTGVNFEFATAGRIVFGAGTVKRLGALAREWGSRALLVTSEHLPFSSEQLVKLLDGMHYTQYVVTSEPTIQSVQEAVALARQEKVDLVIGLGGGSALDTAKAVAALVNNPGLVTDYLEVVGLGKPLGQSPLPVIAIPTTAGTGSEVTRNAVLGVPEQRVKVSLRHPLMLPRLALVDPELTYSLPPEITAYTGLDALTQVLEPFVSNRANPLTDSFCRAGLLRAARSLRRATAQGDDPEAREDMSLASLFGGLALANARLGAVHGFAGPLGGMFPAPHGAVCARLLPFVVEANLEALHSRQPEDPVMDRYAEITKILTGNPKASLVDGVNWLHALCSDLHIPGLASYGLTVADFPVVIPAAARASSMQGNPVRLTEAEMEAILLQAL
jgi:alcohol dehydrogenase class IV